MKFIAAGIVIVMIAVNNEILSLVALSVLGVMGLYRIISEKGY